MNLLGPIACGVAGAGNGTVEIRHRGTSTFATYYTTAEGAGATTPTAGVLLDSNGGAELYVNQAVDCLVYNSSGSLVRRFTVMDAAADVEIRSQSFTGVDYTSGTSAVSNPVDAATVFDRWKTSAGSVDWNVLFNGSSVTIQTALASFAGVFINVKSPTYGAVGDGSTDDTSAIQAALTAAVSVSPTNGAIVFFPPGVYKTTSNLNVGQGVSLMGCGPLSSFISLNHATANCLTFTYNDTAGRKPTTFVLGLSIGVAQGNSGKQVVCEAGAVVTFLLCAIGGTQTFASTGKCVSVANAASIVSFYACSFRCDAAAAYHIYSTAGRVTAVGCSFVWGSSTMSGNCILVNGGSDNVANVFGCDFDLSAVSVGASAGAVLNATTGTLNVSGCRAVAPSTSTLVVLIQGGDRCVETGFFDCSNVAHSAPAGSAYTNPATNHEGTFFLARHVRKGFITDNTAAISIPANNVGMYEVRRTNNGAQTINFAAPLASGMDFTLSWNNDHAAVGGTITLGGQTKGLTSYTVNANCVSHFFFRSIENAPAGAAGAVGINWVYVGSSTQVTP